MKSRPLSSRELAFCRAMLTEPTAIAAALKANYSPTTASKQAFRLSKKVGIQKKIAELRARADTKALSLRARIQAELELLAFCDIKDYVTIDSAGAVTVKPFDQMPAGASRAIRSVEEQREIVGSGEGDGKKDLVLRIKTKIKHHDKLGALKELSKVNGLYPEEGLGEVKAITYVIGNAK